MSKVELSKVADSVFGNCIKLTNGIVELLVTLDYGPRVIHFSLVGMENMLYQDKKKKPLDECLDVFGKDVLTLYGGHRIWVSPEVLPRCYYPDNEPVMFEEIEGGVRFTAPVERVNNIQKILTVKLNEDSSNVLLEHTIKNCGVWDITLAPWCITMVDAGGVLVCPQPKGETGYLPNRSFAFWEYTDMSDKRVYFGKEFITIKQHQDMANPFKFGYNNEAGYAAYFNKGQIFFKFFETVEGGNYPDNGCCFEAYTNGVMLEMESLGELVILEPEALTTHIEEWELYPEESIKENSNNEIHIENVLNKYIR